MESNLETYSIYKATNKISGKTYIGFTNNFARRLRGHEISYTKLKKPFYDAIRKYGWDTFLWEELYVSMDKQHCLNEMESYFIREYDSINFGYNLTDGGSGVIGVTKRMIWVNDGNVNRRVFPDSIPNGFELGRVGLSRSIKMSEECKRRIGRKNKERGSMIELNKTVITCQHCGLMCNPGAMGNHIKHKH